MNLKQINEIRATAGLPALESKSDTAAKRRQAANRAARGQASRDLKALRGSGKKGR
jgi:hypothetical protein